MGTETLLNSDGDPDHNVDCPDGTLTIIQNIMYEWIRCFLARVPIAEKLRFEN